jgi:hypothetical protein
LSTFSVLEDGRLGRGGALDGGGSWAYEEHRTELCGCRRKHDPFHRVGGFIFVIGGGGAAYASFFDCSATGEGHACASHESGKRGDFGDSEKRI